MANIKISDLRPTGSELFADSESYMAELADSELDVSGGLWTVAVRLAAKSSVRCLNVINRANRINTPVTPIYFG